MITVEIKDIQIDYFGPYIIYNLIEYIVATLLFIILLIIYNKKAKKNKKSKKIIVNILLVAIFFISMILSASQKCNSLLALLYTYGYNGYIKALIGTILYIILIVTMIVICIIKNKRTDKKQKGEK